MRTATTGRTAGLDFEAPGPGVWQRDEDHWPRPVPASYREIYPDATVPYVKEWTSRYGLLLDYFETAFVNGFGYARMHAVGEPEGGGSGPPPKLVFKVLVRLHPQLRARRRAAERALEERLWLADLRRWEEEAKPAIVADNRANAAVDRAGLSDAELLEHVDECRETLRRLIGIHHRYNGGMLPVGLLLVAMDRWTGDRHAVLELLEGASPVSSGRSPELTRLAAAVRDDATARSWLDGEPEVLLGRLAAADGELGAAYEDYRQVIGCRLVGDSIDHGNPTLVEVPELMARTIRTAVEGGSAGTDQDALDERAAAVRSQVPPEERGRFDQLLEDTLATYRMRDERSVFGDVWAAGIFRQALLELGRRLVARGALEEPVHLIEATSSEVRALAAGTGGPDGAELAERARFRREHADYDAPAALGGEPSEPPPAEWLPSGLREMNAAVFAQIGGFLGRGESQADDGVLRGAPASPGRYEGTARVIIGPEEFARLDDGDVLVARTTSEAFNVVLPLLGAIVTDRGGPLSHAAIVSREAGIPCVVATGEATSRIPDGSHVLVDGTGGEVVIS